MRRYSLEYNPILQYYAQIKSKKVTVSKATKLNLVQFVDRGIMTPNEVRYYLNLAPVDGGDVLVRRLDTAKVSESDTDQKEGSE